MLYLDVPVGDALVIEGGRIVIHFQRKKGQMIRVGVEAARNIPVSVAPKERPQPWAKGLTVK